jgi:hypothetical protein
MYSTDELWEQALKYHGSLVYKTEIEEQVDAHGVIMRKTGYGYEFRTYHSGGEYFDKISEEHIHTMCRLGFDEGVRYVACKLLEEKLERYSRRPKAGKELVQSIKNKIWQLQNNNNQQGCPNTPSVSTPNSMP